MIKIYIYILKKEERNEMHTKKGGCGNKRMSAVGGLRGLSVTSVPRCALFASLTRSFGKGEADLH